MKEKFTTGKMKSSPTVKSVMLIIFQDDEWQQYSTWTHRPCVLKWIIIFRTYRERRGVWSILVSAPNI